MTLEALNNLPEQDAVVELSRCCGCERWVREMIARRPFRSKEELLHRATSVWRGLSEREWREAFAHHPEIGDVEGLRKKFATTAAWASTEQSAAVQASSETLQRLADGNRRYREKFGYIFIVSATGKSATDMLQMLDNRLMNAPRDEIHAAAGEQEKITLLRLERLLFEVS